MALTVGLDLDGVFFDFQGGWAAAYEKWFGVEIDRKKLNHYDAYLAETHFETPEEFWAWINAVPNFWANLSPLPGAQGGVYNLLYKQGHTIDVITSRHAMTRPQTTRALELNWPDSKTLPQLHHVGSKLKGTVPMQVYVDDTPAVVESLAETKPCVILFDQPWNKGAEVAERDNVHRVSGWTELVAFLADLNKGSEDAA